MMSCEEFTRWLQANIIGSLPSEFQDARADIHNVPRAGGSYVGLTVLQKGSAQAPVMPIEPLYELHKNGAEKFQVLATAAYWIKSRSKVSIPDNVKAMMGKGYEGVRDTLIVRVLNTSKSSEVLSITPHVVYGDIALACYGLAARSKDFFASFPITYDMCKQWDMDPDQVFQDALLNSPNVLPADIYWLNSSEDTDNSKKMILVTNEIKTDGAAALFYPGIMEDMSTILGGSFIVLPISVNEVVLVAESDKWVDGRFAGAESLKYKIEDAIASDEDFLSDQVYFFDSKANTFGLFTDRQP